MLTLEDIHLQQGDFQLCANFTVNTGARIAVVGPSGAGKSTLLNAIAGFFQPASGRILWNGQDLSADLPGARPMSMLFQDNNLFPHLTVFQNIGLGLKPTLRLAPAERAQVSDALGRVGLAGMEARKPAELSGGQQSRVALARALLRAKPLMLLDEPFAALGPALKAEMLALVLELAVEVETTVLMVTHAPQDASAFATDVVLIADGKAHPPEALVPFTANPPAAMRAYLGT
jgi:thiamine transport system ATP-binding protein